MKKPSLLVIFLTVFLDLVGFGIVLPLLTIYSENFGASGVMAGIIMASFSAMQFLFAPIWGRWSDKVGRRPVLLISNLGSALSYALFAIASGMQGNTALWMLLASRIFAGICGANISVAQAYIADITPPEDRSKRMGLIGMAFGLGFILGPVLSGLSLAGFSLFGLKFNGFGMPGPGWVAAVLCAGNFLLTYAILPESHQPSSEHAPDRPRRALWAHTLARPQVGMLVWLFFLATFAFSCFETTLTLLVSRNFGLNIKNPDDAPKLVHLFSYCGIIGALVQGGAIGRAVKKLGEPKLIAVSMLCTAASLAPLPFVRSWGALLGVLALLSIGSSMARAPIFGLLSILTPAHEQGETIGVAQSFGSLARIFGPIFAATLFYMHPSWPYLICAGVSLAAGVLAWSKLQHAAGKPA